MVRKLVIRLVRGSGRLGMFRGQSHKKSRKCLGRSWNAPKKIRSEELARVVYDVKSVKKFGGIVE